LFILRAVCAEDGFCVFFDDVCERDDAVGAVVERFVAGDVGGAGLVDGDYCRRVFRLLVFSDDLGSRRYFRFNRFGLSGVHLKKLE